MLMVKLNKYFLITILLLLFLVIPTAFADANQTDYYFDVNVDNEGNGTVNSPYCDFSNDKITDNSIVHFASGNYSFTDSGSYSNISFYGKNSKETILDGKGHSLNLLALSNFKNITLTNIKITTHESLNASNTIFCNLISNTCGSIYAPSCKSIYFNNCSCGIIGFLFRV